jgi:hypothetical protein
VLHAALDVSPPRPVKRVAPATETTPPANDPSASEPPREEAQAPTLLVSGDLLVEIDAAAGRFVHKLFDRETEEMLRQWPSERQLAFARGVRAYLAALRV